MNIATVLEMSADILGPRTAYGPVDTGVSFARLYELSRSAAHKFRAARVDHVALIDENSTAVPVALFGAALAGIPYTPINYRLAPEAATALLARLGHCALVAGDAFAHLAVGEGPVLTRWDLLGDAQPCAELLPEAQDPAAVAALIFTSGTTGPPKAAVLRHRNLLSYILQTVEFASATDDEAALVCVPPYHVAGVAAVLSAAAAGRRVVHLPNFAAEHWITAVQQESITHAMVVPTMLARIVESLAQREVALDSLRYLSYGGGRMPLPVIEEAIRLMPNVSFVNAYGLTETSSSICLLGPDDHRIAFDSTVPAIRHRLNSVGRPIAGVDVEIRDPDGRRLGGLQRGEVWVRGAQVAGEYSGSGSAPTEDGWFATNDGGYLDDDGYLFLEGRLDDLIVRGGENMSPGEIEDVLLRHDAIDDAAVIGAPDDEWGEKIVAFVTPRSCSLTADEIRSWVTSHLRASRAPRDVHFVDDLPYNETGKLLRRELRSWLSTPSTPGDGSTHEHATSAARTDS